MIFGKYGIAGLCIVYAVLVINHAMAVTTSIWEQKSQQDFSAGKPKEVSISSKNEVALSRALVAVKGEISELRVWCLAQDSQGNVYAGTGDEGKIFKVTSEGEASLLFDSPETDIFSLIVDKDDNIYAGTSPDGIIYRIKPDQVPETFFSSGEKYVWSMAFDKAGNLYAGTGMTGKLYRISPEGEGKVVYDSSDPHIKCVLSSGDNIYAGTEGGGIIYKISPEGKAFVLYDTSDREICCLAMDANGNLYAGTASGESGPQEEEQEAPGPPGIERGGRKERRGAIYQITSEEVVNRIWVSPEPLIYSMILDGKNLLVGTGDEGKIFSVTPDGDWWSVADCEDSQVLSLHKASNGVWLATGNSGKLYKLSSDYVKEGTLESQQQDASVTSKWGKISWDAILLEGTSVALSTRSGNTEKADDTWSKWSPEYTNPTEETITSPDARFIQWRAKFTSADGAATPVLKCVSISYLQRNLKPVIRSVSIGAEKEGNGGPPRRPPDREPGEGNSNEEATPISGKKMIKWDARDPNGDSLEYSIYFRGIEERNWKLMEEELTDNSYPFDSESFPDGTYVIRVVASDSPGNPDDLALSEEEISDPFDVDNTPPKVAELAAKSAADGRYVVTGRIEDSFSYIKSIVYSIDGGDWKLVFPSDQILDSKMENFSFPTEALAEGEHTIAVKATDAAGNAGAGKTLIQGK